MHSDLCLNRLTQSQFCFGQIMQLLQVEPKLRGCCRKTWPAAMPYRCDGALAAYNLANPRCRNVDVHGELILTEP